MGAWCGQEAPSALGMALSLSLGSEPQWAETTLSASSYGPQSPACSALPLYYFGSSLENQGGVALGRFEDHPSVPRLESGRAGI